MQTFHSTVHHMSKSLWTCEPYTCWIAQYKTMGNNMELHPTPYPSGAITACTLPQEGFKQAFVSVIKHTHSVKKQRRPGSQSTVQFIPKVFSQAEIGILSRTLEFLNTSLIQHCLCGPHFVQRWHIHPGTGKDLPPHHSCQSLALCIVILGLCAGALTRKPI